VSTIGDKEILEVQMEHRGKTIEVVKRHKIHPKAKSQMNIPLYHMIFVPVVRLDLKIDVFKMDRHSKWPMEKVKKFYVSLPQTSKARRHLLYITSMSGTNIGRV
jgi:hypothetical protein